ncbi:hypothetical protein [Microbacterium sp. G2-8]|uniref:hypothetical protein n=1 Tax=Microbacterium sp. G2-8 TaxID=2842454 RepID=UPI0021AA7064|nr:hypothetical protein [Microbacterium sp. G2-8]
MTEPQVWVMIGMFSTVMFGVLSVFLVLNWRMLNSVRNELQTEMRAGFDVVHAKFDAMNTKMDERFARVDEKIDHLDRDVSALIRRDFGEQR